MSKEEVETTRGLSVQVRTEELGMHIRRTLMGTEEEGLVTIKHYSHDWDSDGEPMLYEVGSLTLCQAELVEAIGLMIQFDETPCECDKPKPKRRKKKVTKKKAGAK
jgi:hypothetical protein